MNAPCHPSPNAGPSPDPYRALGLDHDATPAQIKAAYRKLALRYHPDRQPVSPATIPTPRQSPSTSATTAAYSSASTAREAADRFSEISAAYAILSDPLRKRDYDHLYKYGAFDAGGGGNCTDNNYRYAEDYSGGYYREGYVPPNAATYRPPQHPAAATAAAAFQGMQSQDSFFDDLIYSPRSASHVNGPPAGGPPAATDGDAGVGAPRRKKKPGIGFSIAPLGRHLSVHVPSRNEVMMNVARGGGGGSVPPARAHLFGTRVTISEQSTSGMSKLERIAGACGGEAAAACVGREEKERKVVCQTTRIARGQKRIVKRTAHLRSDGTKEVVIEEGGVVRRRYVEENPNINNSATANPKGDDCDYDDSRKRQTQEKEGEEGSGSRLQKEDRFTLLGLFKSCVAPCSSTAA